MYGGYTYNFNSLILGRFLFGMGTENEYVVQSLFIAKWFSDGPILALATGLCIGIPYLASFYSGTAVSGIYEHSGLGASFGAGVYILIMSLIAAIVLFKIDRGLDHAEQEPLMERT